MEAIFYLIVINSLLKRRLRTASHECSDRSADHLRSVFANEGTRCVQPLPCLHRAASGTMGSRSTVSCADLLRERRTKWLVQTFVNTFSGASMRNLMMLAVLPVAAVVAQPTATWMWVHSAEWTC